MCPLPPMCGPIPPGGPPTGPLPKDALPGAASGLAWLAWEAADRRWWGMRRALLASFCFCLRMSSTDMGRGLYRQGAEEFHRRAWSKVSLRAPGLARSLQHHRVRRNKFCMTRQGLAAPCKGSCSPWCEVLDG
eukprot:597588-Pelagomonas_calceolata.AAC.7